MKKLFTLFLFFFLLVSFSVSAYAIEKDEAFISSGYTPEGYHYEAYGTPIVVPATALGRSSITIERCVIFDGKIIPPSELEWSESTNGVTYSGKLKLSRYTYFQNKTTAYYIGSLSSD